MSGEQELHSYTFFFSVHYPTFPVLCVVYLTIQLILLPNSQETKGRCICRRSKWKLRQGFLSPLCFLSLKPDFLSLCLWFAVGCPMSHFPGITPWKEHRLEQWKYRTQEQTVAKERQNRPRNSALHVHYLLVQASRNRNMEAEQLFGCNSSNRLLFLGGKYFKSSHIIVRNWQKPILFSNNSQNTLFPKARKKYKDDMCFLASKNRTREFYINLCLPIFYCLSPQTTDKMI